jgi:hypothetical protein
MTDLTGSYRKLYDSRFLAADDMPDGKDFALTVTKIDRQKVQGGDDVVAIHFAETPKMMALNRTNAALIRKALGSAAVETWIGKKITLYGTVCNAFGDPKCPCIRVRAPRKFG